MEAKEKPQKFKERYPRSISFHCTEAEYEEWNRILKARQQVTPGLNFRGLFHEMLTALQRQGFYRN